MQKISHFANIYCLDKLTPIVGLPKPLLSMVLCIAMHTPGASIAMHSTAMEAPVGPGGACRVEEGVGEGSGATRYCT